MPPQPSVEHEDITETPIAIPHRGAGHPTAVPGAPDASGPLPSLSSEWEAPSLEGLSPRQQETRRAFYRIWLPAVAMVGLGWGSVALGGALAMGWLALR